jgi:phage baseplate assembly protein W
LKNFLGQGFGFPLGTDAHGAIRMSTSEENIAESIRIVLGTAIGERLMRPDFGCRMHDLVFHPNNANTCSMVTFYVRECLVKWEPRVEDVKVRCHPDPHDENVILIVISYKVRQTNSMKNLVYPFFLRREQDL